MGVSTVPLCHKEFLHATFWVSKKQYVCKIQAAFHNHIYQWVITWTLYLTFVAKWFHNMHVFSSFCTPWLSGRTCWCHIDILTEKQCLNKSRWRSSKIPSSNVNGKAALAVSEGQREMCSSRVSRDIIENFMFSLLWWRPLLYWPKLATH